ncbi:MSC_0882 family membrane protein [Mycoplasmopsis gallinacea]|uniref:Uncharacterized protein n=1 Tax=Mycoplasmopsis gallinacea TaxID=29556 RepID=A0A449A318_9BACT|nr:hypothetical protein [Mycoplasmopsis gallinacea]VEU58646.1 Uncharacterised protein [Mycoplasmopsis gallinacea]
MSEFNFKLDTETQKPQNSEANTTVYKDPKGQLSPAAFAVIKKESRIRIYSIIFWAILFLGAAVGLLLNYLLNTRKDPNSGILLYVAFAALGFFTFWFFVKNIIKLKSWKNVERNYRESYNIGDSSSSTTFAEAYRTLNLKSLRLKWFYGFYVTYMGLFILIVALLKNQVWQIDPQYSWLTIKGELNFPKLFEIWFGNTNALLIILGIVSAAITALFVLALLYDKKRIVEIQSFLGDKSIDVVNAVNNDLKSENKAWRRLYIIVFILLVLLPLAIIIYLIYRKVLSRRK